MNIKNMSKNEKIYYFVLCCLAIVLIAGAYQDGIDKKLFKEAIGFFFFQAYLYCKLFHSKCTSK